MKILSFLSILAPITAFVTPCTPRAINHFMLAAASKENPAVDKNKKDTDKFVADAQHEWQEQSEHLRQHQSSLWNDPDLDSIVDHHHDKRANPVFRNAEAHRHDSLAHEMQHAIENDPDLRSVTIANKEAPHHQVNHAYRNQEAHRHDSLLDEITHSVRQDPDLKA